MCAFDVHRSPENNFLCIQLSEMKHKYNLFGMEKTGTSLHYTIIAHSIWKQRCPIKQYFYIVSYEAGVMIVSDGSFLVSECLSPADG